MAKTPKISNIESFNVNTDAGDWNELVCAHGARVRVYPDGDCVRMLTKVDDLGHASIVTMSLFDAVAMLAAVRLAAEAVQIRVEAHESIANRDRAALDEATLAVCCWLNRQAVGGLAERGA